MGFTWSKKLPRVSRVAVEVGGGPVYGAGRRGWKGLWGKQSGPPGAGQMWGDPCARWACMYTHTHTHTLHTHEHELHPSA